MNQETWKGIVLKKQGLLEGQSVEKICQNLNGLQAQFQPYVHIGFQNRMTEQDFQQADWQEKLTRQWSIRRTVHAYLKSEIPLYIHEGRMADTAYLQTEYRDELSPQTKQRFHQVILEGLSQESLTRDQIKDLCRAEKISLEDEKRIFNA